MAVKSEFQYRLQGNEPGATKTVTFDLDQGETLGLDVSIIRGLEQVMQKTLAGGWSELDYSALYNAVNPSVKTDSD